MTTMSGLKLGEARRKHKIQATEKMKIISIVMSLSSLICGLSLRTLSKNRARLGAVLPSILRIRRKNLNHATRLHYDVSNQRCWVTGRGIR